MQRSIQREVRHLETTAAAGGERLLRFGPLEETALNLLERGRAILAQQPFSVLLGAELTRFEPGLAELRVPLRQDLLQQNGFAHGGVVSYSADNALTYAGGSTLDGSVVTSEFKINYVRPAVGATLIARASVVYAGRSQAVCQCEVFVASDAQEKLCAVAQGTIALLSRDA